MRLMKKQDLEAFKERLKEAREKAEAEGRPIPVRKFKRPTEGMRQRFKELKAEGRTPRIAKPEMREKMREALSKARTRIKTEE